MTLLIHSKIVFTYVNLLSIAYFIPTVLTKAFEISWVLHLHKLFLILDTNYQYKI